MNQPSDEANHSKLVHPLTLEQAREVLLAIKGHPLWILVYLALTTGQRPGELLVLTWQDIDFEHAFLTPQRTLVPGSPGQFREARVKAGAHNRRVPLRPGILAALQTYREMQQRQREQVETRWYNHDSLFGTVTRAQMYPDDDLFEGLQQLLKQAGLPGWSLHHFRQSVATWVFTQGMSLEEIQAALDENERGPAV
ncbi:MAG TPA: tyrosine-type recombinase/integrase [Ktedonobacteraceae bacterium]|nr:tyrosine-type recombinase/integrase [Ktedonobacteraceae bacterium]